MAWRRSSPARTGTWTSDPQPQNHEKQRAALRAPQAVALAPQVQRTETENCPSSAGADVLMSADPHAPSFLPVPLTLPALVLPPFPKAPRENTSQSAHISTFKSKLGGDISIIAAAVPLFCPLTAKWASIHKEKRLCGGSGVQRQTARAWAESAHRCTGRRPGAGKLPVSVGHRREAWS